MQSTHICHFRIITLPLIPSQCDTICKLLWFVYCVVVWLWNVWQHFKSLYKIKKFAIFILYAILLWIPSVLNFRPTFHKGRIAYEGFRIALQNGITSTDISDCRMEGFICRSLIKNKIRPFSIHILSLKWCKTVFSSLQFENVPYFWGYFM